MNEDTGTNSPEGRRAERRTIVDKYYSVEFLAKDLEYIYQFKIWNISLKGMCVLVKEDSVVLDHLKIGDTLNMKYYPVDSMRPVEYFQTEIKHITKDEQGRFKGHYLVGLSIKDKLKISE